MACSRYNRRTSTKPFPFRKNDSQWNSNGEDCGSECSPEDYVFAREQVRIAWAHGVQVGAPFWEYKKAYSEYRDNFFLRLRSFFDSVDTWEDEPGTEIVLDSLPTP
ncbi:MAG: hypothetical protein GXP49_10290 [Deltaproteobacteria bacterium]|nr:hypothetical protein [Deltaproteobacteria bacterium]